MYLGQVVVAQELADVGGHGEVRVRFGVRSGTMISQILQMGDKRQILAPAELIPETSDGTDECVDRQLKILSERLGERSPAARR